MKNRRPSIDGFVPRRSGDILGGSHSGEIKHISTDIPENRPLHITSGDADRTLGQQKAGFGLGRSDIDESLREIDKTDGNDKKLSRRQRRKLAKLNRKPRGKIFKVVKWLSISIIIAVIAAGGYMVYKFIGAGNNIFQGNIMNIFNSQPLKEDSNGRSHFLILGTSEDDPGHGGANLTDSIMVVSVDQKNKNIYMFSVPRDLYVEYGMACNSGYSGKINEYFMCSNVGTTKTDEQDRLAKTQKFVGDIFGIDIQYGIHVNHTVIKQAVDAIGGVDVDIQGSNGDSGILDRNFDWRCKYNCYLVKYENGVQHLDGEHALYLSQARGDVAPTYGLGNSNFDREKNQQKILIAIREKALSTGTLSDLSKVTKLIDALGDNLRTNIATDEIRTIMEVASKVEPDDIRTISLVGDDEVVKSGSYGGASVVMPSAGIYDYTEIQTLISKNFSSNPITREAAPIVVLNGTGQSGFGQTKANALTAAGFVVATVDNAPDGDYGEVEIYQIGTGNSATAKKLSDTYNNVTIKKTTPPVTVDASVNFVIVFGATSSQ